MPVHDDTARAVPAWEAAAETEVVEVAAGVHVHLQPDGGWCLSNAGVVTGPDLTVVVDTAATERRARLLREAVDRLAPGPPRVVVNTHFHGDHTFGNAAFGPQALVVARPGTREEIVETGLALTGLWPDVGWGDVRPVPPQLTFTDRMTLHTGTHRVELIAVEPAHTRHDTVAWLPGSRILFAGDIVMPGCTPFVLMGTVDGSLEVLDVLRALRPDVIVGGHGRPAGPEAFDEAEAYLRWVRETARDGLRRGLSPLETARAADLGRFAGLRDPERLVGNLHRAFADLEGGEPARPLDVPAVFAEIVEFNGRLPACHA